MKYLKLSLIVLFMLVPMLSIGQAIADDGVKEGKIEWFIDDVMRLNNAQDYRTDVASVWPAEKITNGGYVLPGSHLLLHYRSMYFRNLSMLEYSPDGQIVPIFINKYQYQRPVKNNVQKQKIQVPPVEGRAGVILIASKQKLDREIIAEVAKNPDANSFPEEVESVSFCHFIVEDYMDPRGGGHEKHHNPYGTGGGYNTPDTGGPAYSQTRGGGYNQPMYYPGTVTPNQGTYGPDPIPLSQMGSTYYFYPDGRVSQNYNPYYYYPYYYNRPMYYGYPGNMKYNYNPPQQRYYVVPGQNGVRTNLQDFIFQANTNYGSFLFGEDGYLGGRFFFDGKNPAPNGLVFRFPVKNTWEHEGPDGSWTYDVPSDFDFYLNGQPMPIYGGGQGDPFVSIPMGGFLINGLNEFKLLPRSNENFYGIGPIEIIADIEF